MIASTTRFVTWGPVCGCPGIRHRSATAARAALGKHRAACARQGGYSDREVYRACPEGRLWHDADCAVPVLAGPGRQVRFRHGGSQCW